MKKIISGILLILLLTTMSALAFDIQPVKAQEIIYVMPDGSVNPPTAPIQRNGSTYILTGNVNGAIVVEADNIAINGAGYTIQGPGEWSGTTGVDLSGRTNVTLANTQVTNFSYGIMLDNSNYNSIIGNQLTRSLGAAVYIYSGSGNNISGNYMENSGYYSVCDESNGNNIIVGNNIVGSNCGISCSGSDDASGNNLTNTRIQLLHSSNTVNGNEMINSFIQISGGQNDSINGNTFTAGNGILLQGGSYMSSVENNTINGKPLVYLENVSNYSVGYAGQILLVSCSNITIENQTFSNVFEPVQLVWTNSSIISGNNLIAASIGITLGSSSNITITENNFAGADISVNTGSDNNTISRNNITDAYDGDDGIDLSDCSGNVVFGNNIRNCWNMGIQCCASNNNIIGNYITGNCYGIGLESCGNIIAENTIANNNEFGFWLIGSSASNNRIYHNSIMGNKCQVISFWRVERLG